EKKEKGLKPILEIIDKSPLFPPSYLSFAREVAHYYATDWFEILRLSIGSKGEIFPFIKEELKPLPSKESEFIPYLCLSPSWERRWERYIALLKENISQGREILFIFPEWEAYAFLKEKISSCFPGESAFFSSALTSRQRRKNLEKIIGGEAKIIAGTRSAIWLPITNLGMIVVEDIHSSSYKSPSHPRYFLPEVALIRGKVEKIPVVLSSPVPPIEYLYLMEKGEIREFTVNGSFNFPTIEVVNMRRENRRARQKGLSKYLIERMKERLDKGDNIALLVNRRGFAGYRVCKVCGYIQKCKVCDIPLSYHKPDRMVCHQCGGTEEVEEICPRCQASYTRERAIGTQKVEETLKEIFPGITIIRCDKDTRNIKLNAEKFPFILVGTKMVKRVFMSGDIGLLGVINADTYLFRPDFRSSEKTFQFLGEWISLMEGKEVIIQSYHTEDFSVKYALNLDWEGFYREELERRKELFYPPFSHIFYLIITAGDSDKVKDTGVFLRNLLQSTIPQGVFCLGPSPVQRKGIKFTTQIMLKSSSRDTLLGLLSMVREQRKNFARKGIRVNFDLFPLHA
ncbi:primosomal protein N', partial [Candidatus Calescamantes bacterium]|nr:primosomal protein N' [Candidatus Calescamantes bacterium]